MAGKKRRFVNEWLLGGNATEAAKKAGYSAKTAYSQGQRLLKNVEIREFLRDHFRSEEELTGMSRIANLSKLKAIQEKCMSKGDHNGVIAATKEINRMMGWYEKPKQKILAENPFAFLIKKLGISE